MSAEPITERIEAAVARHGTRVALHEVREGVAHVITYAELGRRIARHVAALEDAGVQPESTVLVAGDGPDAIVAELAVIAAGCVAAPVPRLSAARLEPLLDLLPGGRAAAALTDPLTDPITDPVTEPITGSRAQAPAGHGRRADPRLPGDLRLLPLHPPPGRPPRRTIGPIPGDRPALLLTGGFESGGAGGAPVTFTHAHLAAGLDALARLLPVRAGRRHVAHVPDSPAAQRAFTWHALAGGAQHCHLRRAHEFDAASPGVLVAAPGDYVNAANALGGPAESGGSGRSGALGRVVAGFGGGLGRGLRARAQRAAHSVERTRAAGARLPTLVRARHGLLEATVLAPARAVLGHPAVAVCAGLQALPTPVIDAYFAAGVPIYEAWTPPQAFGR